MAGPRRRRADAERRRDRAKTGARGYVGGWLDRRAGVINPLAYTLELARAAKAAGARIAEREKATALRRNGDLWSLTTALGAEIHAKSVVVATNAYSDGLIPGLAQTIVPLHSFQIATAPLTLEQREKILPEGQAVSDSRRILVYFRLSPDGRLVLGGRGRMALAEKCRRLGPPPACDAAPLSGPCRRADRATMVRARRHDA